MRKSFVLCAALVCGAVIATGDSGVSAEEQDATGLPLVQPGDLTYLGSFNVPQFDGGGTAREQALTYGGFALGMSPTGLYYGCHDWHERLAEISIAGVGGTASILQPCTPVPGLNQIDQDQINLGGTLFWNGRLIVSAYAYYDGDGSASRSHAVGSPSISGFTAFQPLGSIGAGRVGGYMGVVPEEWRGLLGGPAFTGQCCIGIISRSSFGPSLTVFDPDDVGGGGVPATSLLWYPESNPLSGWSSTGELFNGSTQMGGAAFVPGTRSVIFFGRHGVGPFCYGSGSGCGDPEDSSQGTHAYPYRRQAWFYDAADLARVRAGQLQPSQVRPYAVVALPGAGGRGSRVPQTAFDPVTRRVYMADAYHDNPRIHVYEINAGSSAPPPPPPPSPEVCGDEVDNDGDGQVDEGCGTPGPGPGPGPGQPPVAEECGDGEDNDGDGLVDEGCSTQPPTELPAPGPPSRLTVDVQGSTVTFNWLAPITGGPPSGYVLEVGLSSGETLASQQLTAMTSLTISPVSRGRYYVRIRARNASGTSAPSNEAEVRVRLRSSDEGADVTDISVAATASAGTGTVATAACRPPRFTTQLFAWTAQGQATLFWNPVSPAVALAADAVSPLTYVLEVGSAPGAANLGSFPLGRTTALTTGVPAGVYYARVRPVDGCGVGPASNETTVTVP